MPVTPQLFEFQLKATARAARQRIVLPEGNDARVINAASELLQRGLCKVTILGNQDEVLKLAQRLQADISKATIIDPSCYGGIEVRRAPPSPPRFSLSPPLAGWPAVHSPDSPPASITRRREWPRSCTRGARQRA